MPDTATLLDKAATAIKEGRLESARELVQLVLDDEPKNAQAWSFKAALSADPVEARHARNRAMDYTPRGQQIPSTPPLPPVAPQPPPPLMTPPAYTYGTHAPARQSRLMPVLLTLIISGCLVMSGITWLGSSLDGSSLQGTADDDLVTVYIVTYRITGSTNRASLTYRNADGGTEQKDVRVPWEEDMLVQAGAFLYLSAQNDRDYGDITCEILIKDRVIKTSTSEGAYKIASCSVGLP